MNKKRVRYGISQALYGEASAVLAKGSVAKRPESQVIGSSVIDENSVDAREK